jgi:hypothetical protein
MNSFVLSQSVRAAVLFNRYAIDRYTALHESMTVNPAFLRPKLPLISILACDGKCYLVRT